MVANYQKHRIQAALMITSAIAYCLIFRLLYIMVYKDKIFIVLQFILDKLKCTQGSALSNCNHETQAVLTKKLEYEAPYPSNSYDYICNFPGQCCSLIVGFISSLKGRFFHVRLLLFRIISRPTIQNLSSCHSFFLQYRHNEAEAHE